MKPIDTITVALAAGASLALTTTATLAQPQGGGQGVVEAEVIGHVYKPAKVKPTEERLDKLDMPKGFEIRKFATGLGKPRMIEMGVNGAVYVTRVPGNVLMLRDTDGDGKADKRQIVAQKPHLHGIAIHQGKMWLAGINKLYVAPIRPDGTLGDLEVINDSLPDAGQHSNRTLAIGPDGKLYVTVGSFANVYPGPQTGTATIQRYEPDGTDRVIYATGVRNTLGFDWHPKTGELWGMDHGIDWLGDNDQKEELNHYVRGEQYGWPYVYGDGHDVPQTAPPGNVSTQEWAKRSKAPTLLYTAHSAPMQMKFYTGSQLPGEYKNDAFIAMHGSWNRRPPSGYEVVRIKYDESGEPVGFEPFITGFLFQRKDGSWAQFGRPAGLEVANDGTLLIGDDSHGVIYRVTYRGDGDSRQSSN